MKWRSLEESTPGTDTRSLREIFAERRELIEKYVPVEAQEIHTQVIRDLRRDGLAAKSLQIGATAPAFSLPDHHEKVVSSAELLRRGRLVVCFIRGRWDPFCCGQMEAMNRVLPELHAAGTTLLAISPQTVKHSYFMADQHKLRFPLLSDRGNAVARQFGLTYRVPEPQKAIYRRAFVNLPLANGDESWELPIPATYIVGQDGTILWRFADEDPMERAEPDEIVAALR
jgi:peroxiredoxin